MTEIQKQNVHAVIQAILAAQMFLSSVEVVPEYTTGIGRLDFMLIATVKNVGLARFVLRLSPRNQLILIDGLTKQLPLYMNNTNVANGIYSVLWYGNGPQSMSSPTLAGLPVKLEVQMIVRLSEAMCKRIRIFCIDLTKSQSASRV